MARKSYIKRTIWNVLLSFVSKKLHLRLGQSLLLGASTKGKLNYHVRELAESLLPASSSFADPNAFDSAILVGPNDLEVIKLSSDSLLANLNSGGRAFLVAPNSIHRSLKTLVCSDFEIISDDELLTKQIRDSFIKHVPSQKQSWIRQQILKLISTQVLTEQSILLLDADTVLLKTQDWINQKGVQNLNISIEYHQPYVSHFERFMRATGREIMNEKKIGVSFVTHYQLMQREIVREIFEVEGRSFEEGLLTWIEVLDFSTSDSAGSEWHTYGHYIAQNYPEKISLTQWRNANFSRKISKGELSNQALKNEFKDFNSVSLHHYL
jgi:hypothetical protein